MDSLPPNVEYVQKPPVSAWVVHEHGMDTPSFSDLLDLHRSIATGEFDFDRAVHLTARCARNVANATGIAIALLEGNQLVYRAGCGSGAVYVGRHVRATLRVSRYDRGDILRVEDAQTDTRIEAAICRQFGAKSLLILPIYHDGIVAGVLQIFFAEAHAFRHREMGSYRLIAGLVEEAIWYAYELEPKKTAVAASVGPPPTKPLLLYGRRWQALAAILALASCIAYSGRRATVFTRASASAPATAPFASAKPQSANPKFRPRTAAATENGRKGAGTLPRWVWVGKNELDYLAQDVKVRYFIPRPAPQPMQLGKSHVEHIGEDVTVRYFTPEQAVALPPLPRGSAARTAEQCPAGGLCPGGHEVPRPSLNN